jgi:hypothetical protein
LECDGLPGRFYTAHNHVQQMAFEWSETPAPAPVSYRWPPAGVFEFYLDF